MTTPLQPMQLTTQPVDGFSLNARLKYLSYRFFPLALGQMDFLRHSRSYRARWYVIPPDFNVPIAAFDTLLHQVRIVPGSYLWGWNFTTLDGTIADYFIQIGDECTGDTFFSSPAVGNAFRANDVSTLYPVLLAEPHLVQAPGLLTVQITNRATTTRRCQLLLHCSEPCEVIDQL